MPYDPFAVTPLAAPTVSTAPQPTTTTVTPTGTLSPTNALAPVMTPGGGVTGAPLQAGGSTGHLPQMTVPPHPSLFANMPQFMDALNQWRSARQDWRSSRPQDKSMDSMSAWRDAMPSRQDYWSGGVMGGPGSAYTAPAPGNTGIVPPNMLPPTSVGMVPGVPGSMGTNPGGPVMTPGGGGTGAPLQANDWRTLGTNRSGYRF